VKSLLLLGLFELCALVFPCSLFATTYPVAVSGAIVSGEDHRRISNGVTLYFDDQAKAPLTSGTSTTFGIYLLNHQSVSEDVHTLWVLAESQNNDSNARPQLVNLSREGIPRTAIANDLLVNNAKAIAETHDLSKAADFVAGVIEDGAIRIYAGGENTEKAAARIRTEIAPIQEIQGKEFESILVATPKFFQGAFRERRYLMNVAEGLSKALH
jgi:hypothetical protein